MRIVKCVVGQRERFEQMPGFVYCGRAFGGFEASPLANPYRVSQQGLARCLKKYRLWLFEKIQNDAMCKNYIRIFLNEKSVLGCWCVNKENAGEGVEQCHCDVIAKAWRWLQTQKEGEE